MEAKESTLDVLKKGQSAGFILLLLLFLHAWQLVKMID